ncbi:MAG: dephospho-CoA kinase [Bacillota bacterium]
MIVGLTGGIAAGKSTVSQMFKDLGAYLIDFDELAREVVKPGKRAWQKIVEYFGNDILNEDLTLNRQKLGELVFHDPKKLRKLNEIVHPEVFREDQKITDEILSKNPRALIIKDIPLLTEAGAQKLVEKIIVVYASSQTQLERMIERGFNEEEARARIDAQAPLEEKLKYADFIIYNDGPLEDTRKQVAEIYLKLRNLQQVPAAN